MTNEADPRDPPRPRVGVYTETLARLYLRQGFLETALGIYRQLAQDQPQKPALQEMVRCLEQRVAAAASSLEDNGAREEKKSPGVVSAKGRHRASWQVVTRLERWLHYLQRQRSKQGGSRGGDVSAP